MGVLNVGAVAVDAVENEWPAQRWAVDVVRRIVDNNEVDEDGVTWGFSPEKW